MSEKHNLSNVKLFQGVEPDKINKLIAACQRKTYATDEVVFRQSDTSDFLVLVVEGDLKVENNGYILANVVDNEIVGEMGVFTGLPRSANVIATTPSKCIIMPKEILSQFIDKNPKEARQIFTNVITVLAQHLKNNNFIIELSQLERQLDS